MSESMPPTYTQNNPQRYPQVRPPNRAQVGRRERLAHLRALKSYKLLADKSDAGQIINMATRVNASRLTEALETQELLLREEQAQTIAISAEIDQAKEVLRKLSSDYEKSAEKQATLSRSIMLLQDTIKLIPNATMPAGGIPSSISGPNDGRTKPARIGKIHYRMLVALRDLESASVFDLAARSQTSIRRIKSQMAEDTLEGLVIIDQEVYVITEIGLDLLRRFEEYRRSVNKSLPPLEVSPEETKQEEGEEDDNEEAESGLHNGLKEEY